MAVKLEISRCSNNFVNDSPSYVSTITNYKQQQYTIVLFYEKQFFVVYDQFCFLIGVILKRKHYQFVISYIARPRLHIARKGKYLDIAVPPYKCFSAIFLISLFALQYLSQYYDNERNCNILSHVDECDGISCHAISRTK